MNYDSQDSSKWQIETNVKRVSFQPKLKHERQKFQCGYPIKKISYRGPFCEGIHVVIDDYRVASFAMNSIEESFTASSIIIQASENRIFFDEIKCPVKDFIVKRLGKPMEEQMIPLQNWEFKMDFYFPQSFESADVTVDLDIEYFVVTYQQNGQWVPIWICPC